MSFFEEIPENPRRKKQRAQERKLKLIRYGLPFVIVLVVVLIDFLAAYFVYHDMSCMIARCVITHSR